MNHRPGRFLRGILLFLLAYPMASRAEGPSQPPRPPREEQAAFVLADPALTIELVAAEPEVASPVAIAWDEEGRLFVAEMLDYPTATTSGRIRMLEDRDGDGRYEHATVFADGLPFPNGVLPCYGGLLVTAAPNIWFFRDDDGDGRADERRVVLSGFGEGNTQLRVNGLTWGLDNWIYVANGRSDGAIRVPADPPDRAVSIRRRDARFRLHAVFDPGKRALIPTVVALEAIAGFSQFGLPHDDWGNRFPSWNTIPIRHVVLEQDALDRNPYLAETASVAEILDPTDGGRIFGISPPQARFNRESVAFFNASCGPMIERGGLLPAAYHGNAFVCEPLSNLVHRRVLEPSGVTFIARRVEQGREFLTSTDPAFRPVNLANGPEGALYVVDMYRELVEHPQFVPEPSRDAVDFRRWHDRGRIWRIRPKSPPDAAALRRPKLSKADERMLVALLGSRNGWWRVTAQRLLVERGEFRMNLNLEPPSVPLLRLVLRESPTPLARLHALWTLIGIGAAVTPEEFDRLAGDPQPGLREHALRADACFDMQEIPTESLTRLANDPATRVRLHAALALGDRCHIEPAALAALGRIAARDAADPWMRLAILSGLAETSLAFIPLVERIAPSEGRSQLLIQAAAMVGARNRAADVAALIGMIADRGHARGIDAITLLAGLVDGLERSGSPLYALVTVPPPLLKAPLERLAPLWPMASATAISVGPVPDRLIALDVLARGRPDLAGSVIPALLAASQPREIQSAAARAVARVGKPALADKVLDRWEDLAQATRREILSALASSRALAEPLIRALERQVIAPGELDAATRQGLQQLADAALRARASAVLAKFAPPQRSAVLARYQDALKLPGDARRGEAVFAKNCQTCHQHQGHGHRVGPDLSGIAGRAPDALLSDILDPNRNIEPDYVVLAAATWCGQTHSGLLAEETATTDKLRRAEGVEDTLLRAEIEQLRSTGQSLMPEGLEQTIGPQDMADLIAFLRRGG
ncbi:MAG: PVC-type heme-binding CxxCH protein [Isosphaeraceae bacterium]